MFIETKVFEHKCLILIICLAVSLIKIYMQSLSGMPKLTLFPQGKSSGAEICWIKIEKYLLLGFIIQ